MATATEVVGDALYAAWREELAPWLDALREVKVNISLPTLPTVSDIEELWIHVKTPPKESTPRKGWTLFIEALELMELLARVDSCAAWYLLLELTGQQHVVSQRGASLFGPVAIPKFVVNVKYEEVPNKSTFTGLSRLTTTRMAIWTPGYPALKSKLETKWSEQHDGRGFDREVLGRVKLSFGFEILVEFNSDAAITAALQPIAQLAMANSTRERTPARLIRATRSSPVVCDAFTVVSFRYNLSFSMPSVTNLVLDLVNQAAQYVHVSHLTIARVYLKQLDLVKARDMLQSQLVPWQSRPGKPGVQVLALDVTTFDAATVRALCSSIASSAGLKKCWLMQNWLEEPLPHQAGPDVWWPWLVYALFSRETSHEIHSVTLNIDLLDGEQVPGRPRDVLSRRDPLAYLLQLPLPPPVDGVEVVGEEEDEVTMPMVAAFHENASIYSGYHAYDPVFMVPDIGVSFRVTRNQPEEDYIQFLYPGVGICWTQRSHVSRITPLEQRKSHPVRHLTINYVEEHTIDFVADLLEAVGEPIEWLTIVEHEGPLALLLDNVAAFCPNLKRLDLTKCTTDTLDWFTEPHDSLFKLETLCIDSQVLHDHSSWSRLFSALKDPSHTLARSLRQLHVGAESFPGFAPRLPYTDEVFADVMSVLDCNRYLTRCELWTDDAAMMRKYRASVLAHNDDYIPEIEAPLSPAQKIAFLGVITQPHDTTQEGGRPTRKQAKHSERQGLSARFKLNPEMTKLVFEYAATAKIRVCGIETRPRS